MSAVIDIYTWRSLTAAVNKIITPSSFILDTIFNRRVDHLTDKVDVELITGKQKLARFVNKGEGAQLIAKSDRELRTVTLPRIYEKKVFDAEELASFKSAGSAYATSASDLSSAANEHILTELLDLKNRVIRRCEHLAVTGLATGAISVVQDNISLSYDWCYVADKHKITLSGADKWDQSTAKIIENIKAWKSKIFKATGKNPTTGLLGAGASNLFLNNSKVAAVFENPNIIAGRYDLTRPIYNGSTFLGRWLGIDWYEYINSYVDDSNNEQDMLATNACILYTPSENFRVHNGPIYRILPDGSSITILDRIVVTPLVSPDGTVLEWSCESKPLPVVHNPDEVISVIVA